MHVDTFRPGLTKLIVFIKPLVQVGTLRWTSLDPALDLLGTGGLDRALDLVGLRRTRW